METMLQGEINFTESLVILNDNQNEFKPRVSSFEPTFQYLRNVTELFEQNGIISETSTLSLTPTYSYQSTQSPSVVDSDLSSIISPATTLTSEIDNLFFENDFSSEGEFTGFDTSELEYSQISLPLLETSEPSTHPYKTEFREFNKHNDDVLNTDEQRTAEILLQNLSYIETENSEEPLMKDKIHFPHLNALVDDKRKRKIVDITSTGSKSSDLIERKVPYVSVLHQIYCNIELHQKILNIKKKGIYKCSHCTEFFPDLLKLAEHLDEFKIIRPYKCPFNDCPWSILGLPRKAEVRRHCFSQHELEMIPVSRETDSKLKLFSCPFSKCNRTFKRKDSFRRHEKLVHLTLTSRYNKRMEKQLVKKKKKGMGMMNEFIDVTKFTNETMVCPIEQGESSTEPELQELQQE